MNSHTQRKEEIPQKRQGDRSPHKVRPQRHLSYAALENIFFALSTILFFGFGLVIAEQIRWSWTLVFYVIVFWLVMAYLALPRLHRILTSLYVPNYFIGRTRTPDGMLGDPVNLAFNGNPEHLHAAMTAAGWTLADPITLKSSARIVFNSITRRSYACAPVSPLLLFGETHDFAYQKEVAGSPSKRHHVRFWQCPENWLLPGGYRVDWLAAATYDRSVGVSLFTLQITHKIDSNIDVERDFVTDSVLSHVPTSRVRRLENFSTGYHSRNGGGDMITTDGMLPIVDIASVSTNEAPRTDETAGKEDSVEAIGKRPPSVIAAMLLSVLMVVLSIGSQYQQFLEARSMILEEVSSEILTSILVWGSVAMVVALHLGTVLLVWQVYRGSRLARWLILLFITASQFSQVVQHIGGVHLSPSNLASMAMGLLIIFTMTSQSARDWTSRRPVAS